MATLENLPTIAVPSLTPHSDETGRTVLTWASQSGHEKVVQILLDRRADVHAEGGESGNVSQAASISGYEKGVQFLLERGAKANAQGGFGNGLYAASRSGHEKVVQMLVDRVANANAHDMVTRF
jgi:ankyrin repeat protein